MNPKLLTKAQSKALLQLLDGSLRRTREGWVTESGVPFPLISVSRLRNRGLAKLSPDRRVCSITDTGRETAGRIV